MSPSVACQEKQDICLDVVVGPAVVTSPIVRWYSCRLGAMKMPITKTECRLQKKSHLTVLVAKRMMVPQWSVICKHCKRWLWNVLFKQ